MKLLTLCSSLLILGLSLVISDSAHARDYVPGELIVKLKGKAGASSSHSFIGKAHSEKEMILKGSFQKLNMYHFNLKPGQSVETVIEELKKDPNVEYAEPNYILRKLTVNTEKALKRYSLEEAQSFVAEKTTIQEAIGINEVRSLYGESDTRPIVAVIDTGIDLNHSTFTDSNAIWVNENEIPGNGIDDDQNGYIDDVNGWNFLDRNSSPMDDDGHGTHVAGIILGVTMDIFADDMEESKIRIMPLRFLGRSGEGTVADAVKAIYYAIENGASVLNNSWGGDEYSIALHEAIAYSYEKEVAFVAAAGNSASNNDEIPMYPANYDAPHVVSIAATNDLDYRAIFSNWGPGTVHIGSPGVSILSTYPQDTYGYSSGTSMAAPFVSGIMAMMVRESSTLSGYQLKQILFNNAKELQQLDGIVSTSARLDLRQALLKARLEPALAEQPDYAIRVAGQDRELASEVATGGGCGLVSAMGKNGGGPPPMSSLLLLLLPLGYFFFMRRKRPEDARRYDRFEIESSVTVQVGGKEMVGSVSSISMGGVRIDTDAMLEKGGVVTMKIESPDGSESIEVQGCVVWSEAQKSYGVQFNETKASALQSIAKWTKGLVRN